MARVENNHYFLDTMIGYGYRPFKKSYGWLWLGHITILTIITKITILTVITITVIWFKRFNMTVKLILIYKTTSNITD